MITEQQLQYAFDDASQLESDAAAAWDRCDELKAQRDKEQRSDRDLAMIEDVADAERDRDRMESKGPA